MSTYVCMISYKSDTICFFFLRAFVDGVQLSVHAFHPESHADLFKCSLYLRERLTSTFPFHALGAGGTGIPKTQVGIST